MGFAIARWSVGYSVAVVAAEVVGRVSCRAVACSRRVAVREGGEVLREAAMVEEDEEREERGREEVAAALEATGVVRGAAALIAGREWATDRRAAMINGREGEEEVNTRDEGEEQTGEEEEKKKTERERDGVERNRRRGGALLTPGLRNASLFSPTPTSAGRANHAALLFRFTSRCSRQTGELAGLQCLDYVTLFASLPRYRSHH